MKYEELKKDCIIVNSEKGFLQSYSGKGVAWCKEIDWAWKTTMKSMMAKRIAKKVGGVRLYKLARKGKKISVTPHKIEIYEFTLLLYTNNECDFYIKCSKGTYIRSIANDLGLKTGYLAYLKELRRIKINGYSVENAISLEEFEKYWVSLN